MGPDGLAWSSWDAVDSCLAVKDDDVFTQIRFAASGVYAVAIQFQAGEGWRLRDSLQAEGEVRLVKARRLFLLFLVSSFSSVAQASDLLAVLVQVEGTATITERFSRDAPGPTTRPRVRRARPLQVVGFGDGLRIPQGASVGLVCSTDRWVLLLPSKSERRLDNAICSAGQPLMPGTYRRLAPKAGRLRSIRGAVVLERGTRRPEDEDVTIPMLLEPRDTAVLGGRPDLRWTRVKGATEYLVEMVGEVSFRARFDAEDVFCAQEFGWGDTEVCLISYPQSAPEFPPGTLSYLSIAARRGLASPWQRESALQRVQRLPAAQVAELRARLDALAVPGEIAHQLLEADIYAEEGLLKDALAVYRGLAPQGIPEVLVTLGDIYLETGLLAPAARSYQSARHVAGRPLVIDAAVELGLGWIEYARRNFVQAQKHFRCSRGLYAGQGFAQEAAEAEQAAEEAQVRIQ